MTYYKYKTVIIIEKVMKSASQSWEKRMDIFVWWIVISNHNFNFY